MNIVKLENDGRRNRSTAQQFVPYAHRYSHMKTREITNLGFEPKISSRKYEKIHRSLPQFHIFQPR